MIEELLQKYSDVFLKKKTTALSDTERVSHHIWLVNEVQSLYDSLYNLSANKLDVLRKYLENMQQQQ